MLDTVLRVLYLLSRWILRTTLWGQGHAETERLKEEAQGHTGRMGQGWDSYIGGPSHHPPATSLWEWCSHRENVWPWESPSLQSSTMWLGHCRESKHQVEPVTSWGSSCCEIQGFSDVSIAPSDNHLLCLGRLHCGVQWATFKWGVCY